MASSSTAKESSASSSSFDSSGIKREYEVFLSFRGEDTRNNFTDHLYTALNHKGIYTFRDDEGLERGKEISSELLEAIERSRVSIIVLSKNYVSSTWCLEELAKIVECNDMEKQKVFPVFYKVNPSDIRKQMRDFKTAFDKHEEDYTENLEKVQRWRSALTKIGNLSGWHLQDRSEADVNHVLIENKGTYEVKGIMLDKSKQRITHLNGESFSNMRNLRLLEIRNVDLSRDIEYLSNELRFLKWPEYPLNSLPSNFQPHKLVELNLCRSHIRYLWKDIKAFERLKTIKLSYSHNLIETPDFTRVPNLEMLDLEGAEDCISLEDVSNALRGGTSPDFALHLFNCLKLHENLGQENNLAIMLLKQYLQQPVNLSSQFHIRLPGFDIPEWFSCKNDGNSVEIGLPPDWLNDDFMGIAMCGVFEPALENLDCIAGMRCTMSIMRNRYDFYFKIPSFTAVDSHHLWLAYISRVKFEYHTSSPPDDKPYGSDHVLVGGSTCIHAVFQIEYKKSTGDGDDGHDVNNGDSDSDGDVDNGDGFGIAYIKSTGDDDVDNGDGFGFAYIKSTGDGDDDNDDGRDGDDKKCKVIKCGIRLVYKQDTNYFQESSAAEGSIWIHQKDNCSTGCHLSGRNMSMPTKLEFHCNIRRDYSGWGLDVPYVARKDYTDSDEE
ncbi:hypothetical protein LWI28_005312 [Acer negundo]|uniref:TIR domain-containing protein n=1 Tax=Acer negundo TaxID=4023 RepID=A0AAD5NGQ5_ACENE|nr:hypothetical protein LWI28_005312 [Acer negundo]